MREVVQLREDMLDLGSRLGLDQPRTRDVVHGWTKTWCSDGMFRQSGTKIESIRYQSLLDITDQPRVRLVVGPGPA
jgi:hypothetical protein